MYIFVHFLISTHLQSVSSFYRCMYIKSCLIESTEQNKKREMAKYEDAGIYFPAGTEVEVSNEEDGFRGSWYAATVITPPTPPPPTPITIRMIRDASPATVAATTRKVTIEFKDLMEEEESDKRLRETLDLVQIRPVPPREAKVEFKLSDLVDAFYNDGWWEGVIVKVLEDKRFDVYFRATKELIEFGEEDLRIHREWVYGEWNPPLLKDDVDEASVVSADDNPSKTTVLHEKASKRSPVLKKSIKAIESHETPSKASSALEKPLKALVAHEKAGKSSKPSKTVAREKPLKIGSSDEKRAVKENFVEGTVVEVKSDEDGFQGAWFSATILEVLSNDKFLIEYKTLKTEDDKEFCKEEVDILHIRPTPPDILKVDSYSKHEEVDALYNDGWWVGVISKVYSGSKYLVFFRGTNEELEFKDSDLRVHQEWIDDKWIVTSEALRK